MITYKLDNSTQSTVNNEIREMTAILAEISPTLQSLLEVISHHEAAISTPAINDFRTELKDMIIRATSLTRAIAQDTEKLLTVSEQTGKHLAAIEDHFGAVLRGAASEQPVAA